MTMLHVYRVDRHVAGFGFGGPERYGHSLQNGLCGRTDDLRCFVMARTSPVVTRVVAVTDRGSEVELALSPLIDRFGLRFAVSALPEREGSALIRAKRDGVVVDTAPQPMPPFIHHRQRRRRCRRRSP
jgi:hypothetical protein